MRAAQAVLVRVVDADTIDVTIRVRLKGVDAPEMSTAAGRRAKAWMEKALYTTAPRALLVRPYPDEVTRGRQVADVWTLDHEEASLSARLLEAGHAVPWPRRP